MTWRLSIGLRGIALVMLCLTVAINCGGNPTNLVPGTFSALVHPSASDIRNNRVLAGSYIVAFRMGLPARQGYPSFFHEYQANYLPLIERYGADPRVVRLHYLTSISAEEIRGFSSETLLESAFFGSGSLIPRKPGVNYAFVRVDFSDPREARSALNEWLNRGQILYAEPNFLSRLSQDDNLFGSYADQYAGFNFWWLKTINLEQAYRDIAGRDLGQDGVLSDEEMLQQANRPIIAVLDSGVDYAHPALKDRIWVNPDRNSAQCEDDIHGCNTTVVERGKLGNGDVFPFGASAAGEACSGGDPNCSHGTHVAGIIGADGEWQSNSGIAVGGVCPICRIMVLKIVSKVGNQSGILDSAIIAAFKYVTLFRRQGSPVVRIINASFGKFVRSRSVGLLVRLMRQKNDTILIGAAGNEDTLTMEYPAAFSDAIAVAAVDERLRKVSFSNFGRWIDVSAPGRNILSTVPGEGIDPKSGTSMAAPIVSGVAGLMLARYPGISFQEMRRWLLSSANPAFYAEDHENGFNFHNYYPKIEQDPVRQPLLGHGLVNASGALTKTVSNGQPLFSELNRVRPGCGVIGSKSNVGSLAFWGMACLGCLVWALFRRRSFNSTVDT